MTHVYVLIPVGIGAQSPAGVFTRRNLAHKAAETLWKNSDGYHEFRVECRRLDAIYDTFSRRSIPHRTTTKPPKIEHVNERDVGRYTS